jgi:hypothetical protein
MERGMEGWREGWRDGWMERWRDRGPLLTLLSDDNLPTHFRKFKQPNSASSSDHQPASAPTPLPATGQGDAPLLPC